MKVFSSARAVAYLPMPNLRPCFVLLCLAVVIAELVCPFTKVEESFNMQAMHDFLFSTGTSEFDHHDFPGVVPHTFSGAWLVAWLVLLPLGVVVEPVVQAYNMIIYLAFSRTLRVEGNRETSMIHIDYFLSRHPMFLSHICRLTLAGLLLASLLYVAKSFPPVDTLPRQPHKQGGSWRRVKRKVASRHNGNDCGSVFLLLCLSQFHTVFYISRALPNTFGMFFSNLALAATLRRRHYTAVGFLSVGAAVFRCDMLLLVGCTGLWHTFARGEWSLARGILTGIVTALAGAVSSAMSLDSFLWGQLVWPESVVLLFNSAPMRSAEWGISPWHWYWTRALPRAFLLLYPLVLCIGILAVCGQSATQWVLANGGRVPRALASAAELYRHVIVPALGFVVLYSFLPHKETRFIWVGFPWLLAPVAAALASMLQLKHSKTDGVAQTAQGPSRKQTLHHVFQWRGLQNETAAVFLVRIVMLLGLFVMLASVAVSVAVSAVNYPGGTALQRLAAVTEDDFAKNESACVNQRKQRLSSGSESVPQTVTLFLDAYATMSGINRFQKRHDIYHQMPVAKPGVPGRELRTAEYPLLRRWLALTTLPGKAAVSLTWRCLSFGGLREPLRNKSYLSFGSDMWAAYIEAFNKRRRCPYALTSNFTRIGEVRDALHIQYIKDPRRFMTAEEHAADVTARERSGPLASIDAHHPYHNPNFSVGEVYHSKGIDYALVRASQWNMHLTARSEFELIFTVEDGRARLLRWMKRMKGWIHGKQADELTTATASTREGLYLLALRRKKC